MDEIMNEQVFVCLSEGYARRLKPKNQAEKQQMYVTYPLVIQTGFRSKDLIRLYLKDGSFRDINPNRIRLNATPTFVTKQEIKTLSLEPMEAKQNGM